MKISYNCYRYAPEQAEIKLNGISINHKYSAFDPFNPHNKLYKLLISNNVIADIRKIIRNDDSNIGKIVEVEFTNGKKRLMINNKTSLKAIKRLGWNIKKATIIN